MPRLGRLLDHTGLPRRSVRLRLTLLYGALFLVSGAVLLAGTYVLVGHATGRTLIYNFNGPNGRGAGVVIDGTSADRASGRMVIGSRGVAPPEPDQIAEQARTLAQQAVRQHNDQMHQLLVQSALALAGMTVLSLILGWLVAGRILRPLRTITATARRISASNLGERLALVGPNDELKELGDTFDALLDRLEAAFHAQQQFVANASHELRTPLARQRTVAQVALADPDATVDSLRTAHERVLASGEQQERLIDALLTLARGQAGTRTVERFDLAPLAEELVLARESDAEQRGITVTTTLATAPLVADRRLVERLVANLVDNAIRHNVAGGSVSVTTGSDSAAVVLTVTNTGPVVPPDAVARLLEPFQRLSAERAGPREGLGLGLSIVHAVALAHGATLEVRPRTGGGLEVAVRFPAGQPVRTRFT